MKYKWTTRPLGELVQFTSGGTPSKKRSDYWEGSIPWISAKTLKSERITTSDLFISEDGLNAGSKLAPRGSILLLIRGSGLFNGIPVGLVEREVAFNQDIKCINSRSEIENKFIFYWLISQRKYLMAKVGVTGIGAGKFDLDFLQSLEVPIPSKQERIQIVSFIDAISDKIELNQKINANLQQQLFMLYECLSTIDIPFDSVELKTLCNFQEGYVNPSQTHQEYFDGNIKWLRAVDINESFIINTSRTLTKAGFESAKKSALLFKPKTIVISKSGTIGRLGIIADYMCGNRAVINIAPYNENYLPFIYAFLKSKQREFPDMAVGSVQKNLYVSLFDSLVVSLPQEKLDVFCKTGNSLLNAIYNNCLENTKLSALRDTLLPKLMSGEIDVSVSDIQL